MFLTYQKDLSELFSFPNPFGKPLHYCHFKYGYFMDALSDRWSGGILIRN